MPKLPNGTAIIPPPLSPHEQEISVLKTPRPATTISLSLTTLAEELEGPGFGNAEAMRFLKALEHNQALRINPLKDYIPMCFPPMVVEVKAYSNGKTVYEGQNQAAVAGAYMTDLQHKLANFTESTSHRPHQSKDVGLLCLHRGTCAATLGALHYDEGRCPRVQNEHSQNLPRVQLPAPPGRGPRFLRGSGWRDELG